MGSEREKGADLDVCVSGMRKIGGGGLHERGSGTMERGGGKAGWMWEWDDGVKKRRGWMHSGVG